MENDNPAAPPQHDGPPRGGHRGRGGRGGGRGHGKQSSNRGFNPKPFRPADLPSRLPPPSAKQTFSDKDVLRTRPSDEAIFARSTDLYQVETYPTYHPTCSAFNALVDLVFEELSLADTDVMKRLSKGMLSYYVTGLIWMRVLSLKQINGQALTNAERAVIDALSEGTFNVPQPIAQYILNFGNITVSTGESFIPAFPALPIHRNLGWWGPIDVNNHARYEDFPTFQMGIEYLSAELNRAIPVGAWAPTNVPQNTTANRNLLGYFPKDFIRQEVTNSIRSMGVENDAVRDNVANTGFSLIAMRVVSRILDGTKAFKIESVSFKNLPSGGDLSQVVKILPDDEGTVVNAEARSQIRDFQQDSAGIVGKGICFSYYLVKAGSVAARYANWCCLTNNDGQAVVGVAWYNNRNEHREYPEILQLERFATGSRLAGDFRRLCLESMLLTKSSR